MISALYVQAKGAYFGLPEVDPWDESRDARTYNGPYPVVAHPPCQRYGQLGRVNFARYGGEHNRMGNDKGCFAAALAAVNVWHGVLEHPAGTLAWDFYNIEKPLNGPGWRKSGVGYTCEVWQSAYGHLARKRTWLYYRGFKPPFDLKWDRPNGTHRIGHDANSSPGKPYLQKKAAEVTPPEFRDVLIELARFAKEKP